MSSEAMSSDSCDIETCETKFCQLKTKERIGTINPIFTCQPAGAQYASIGIKDCIGIVHGGQGLSLIHI